MSPTSKGEYLQAIRQRYTRASKTAKGQILQETCATTGYHRKSAIRVLNQPPQAPPRRRRQQALTYGARTTEVLAAIWEAAGYPWSARLKALLPLWLPWARPRLGLTPQVEGQLLAISPSTIDRRLRAKKTHLRRRIYGR
ncbi:MAG: hypothetical protein QME77_08915, partial [bacterium]|nr:hypothetical protein [bacterium]